MYKLNIGYKEYVIPAADAKMLLDILPNIRIVDVVYMSKHGYVSFTRGLVEAMVQANPTIVDTSELTDAEYQEYRKAVDAGQQLAEGSPIVDPTTWKKAQNEN